VVNTFIVTSSSSWSYNSCYIKTRATQQACRETRIRLAVDAVARGRLPNELYVCRDEFKFEWECQSHEIWQRSFGNPPPPPPPLLIIRRSYHRRLVVLDLLSSIFPPFLLLAVIGFLVLFLPVQFFTMNPSDKLSMMAQRRAARRVMTSSSSLVKNSFVSEAPATIMSTATKIPSSDTKNANVCVRDCCLHCY
jgi:hypothetical protein